MKKFILIQAVAGVALSLLLALVFCVCESRIGNNDCLAALQASDEWVELRGDGVDQYASADAQEDAASSQALAMSDVRASDPLAGLDPNNPANGVKNLEGGSMFGTQYQGEVQPVPEPGTLVLLGCFAGVGLAVWGRKTLARCRGC